MSFVERSLPFIPNPVNLEKSCILVAGAAGFVPSHLSEFYLKRGARVIGLDNFITGQHANVELLSAYKNFEFHEVDIIERLPETLYREKVDYIFNMASPASPIDFSRIPIEIMRVNSEGTRRLLELARVQGARILEASTSEVYGDPEVHPQVESYVGHVEINGPRSCYDEAKRFAEAMTSSYRMKYGVDTRIIRIFNTYGPRMRANDGRVIPNFINQALQGEDITVYGDGGQTRSFCFVTDLVAAIHEVMFCNDYTPFNIGNPEEKTILETAKLIVEILNSKSKIVFKELPKDDPTRRRPCLAKLQAVSSYRPLVDFRSGMMATADYFSALAPASLEKSPLHDSFRPTKCSQSYTNSI
ncbi:MAG: NAD-dependent epimerase/dehydratase family protein [Oligoflexia bacterium]|nr:NAD-dependent epimerase/dehydratase family protein [Oligoflexia bacterium]